MKGTRKKHVSTAICLLAATLVASIAAPHAANAEPVSLSSCGVATADDPHVRSTDPTVHALVDEGCRSSNTFRKLVRRLQASDVVVYVKTTLVRSQDAAGWLGFLGSVGGRRYVIVTLDAHLPTLFLAGLLGHELQHAVEIAEAPDVVDPPTMGRLYERIGMQAAVVTGRQRFESQAAIAIGHRVCEELASAASTAHLWQ